MSDILKIDKKDNVVVALKDLKKGQSVKLKQQQIRLKEDIPAAHKIAVKEIKKYEDIIKYGFKIGSARLNIKQGERIHTHNIKTNLRGIDEYRYNPVGLSASPARITGPADQFSGYVREDGSVGIRNEIWVINSTGCVNRTADNLVKMARKKFSSVNSEIFSFSHPFGCSRLGENLLLTQKILAGLVKHPNAAGVLVLSLGCENNNIEEFKKILGDFNQERVKFLITQEVSDEYEKGLQLIGELARYSQSFQREKVPTEKLTVGLKCGASDAFSGITANPLVGMFTDQFILRGGSAILSEVPEMFGAETILMARALNQDIFKKIVKLINDCKNYYLEHGQAIYENPAPGNKKGGISTLEEKSLGCIKKGGTSPVVDVKGYGEIIEKSGLNLLNAPGNDLIVQTALAAAGAHFILFTTGRGNPLGAPVPTIKIASNSELYQRKENWIDFNAGLLLEGQDQQELLGKLSGQVEAVVNGEKRAKNEISGNRDIGIFKDGVIL